MNYLEKFYQDDKVRKPNKVAKFLLWYRNFLLDRDWYWLVTRQFLYNFLARWCNHPYQITTSSRGWIECECCFKHFEEPDE